MCALVSSVKMAASLPYAEISRFSMVLSILSLSMVPRCRLITVCGFPPSQTQPQPHGVGGRAKGAEGWERGVTYNRGYREHAVSWVP
jgi:hypothetical protein